VVVCCAGIDSGARIIGVQRVTGVASTGDTGTYTRTADVSHGTSITIITGTHVGADYKTAGTIRRVTKSHMTGSIQMGAIKSVADAGSQSAFIVISAQIAVIT